MSTAAWKSPLSIRRRNFFDPVMFCHHHESGVGAHDEGLEAAERRERLVGLGDRARWKVANRLGDLADVLRGRSAAASEDVGEACTRELSEVAARDLRVLVVQSHRVGEAGVGVTGRVGGRDA